jgi:hypothetical protein
MKRFAIAPTLLAIALLATAPAHADLLEAAGKVTLLRVHDVGTAYGPPGDVIDTEVIFTLSTSPGKAYGFQLRSGTNQLAHQGMLDLLRDAFTNNWTVVTDFTRDPVKNNGVAIRVWIVK